ncbi:MAG: hypothetical protein NC548_61370, partial [Lachnospiraceae bacterium]|nr:hypothetical protein [Lachnospiraceae bacterium]
MLWENKLPTKKYNILIVFLFLLLFVPRIFFLENDLPAFGIGLYQPKDEGRYSMMAIDYYKYHNLYSADGYDIYTPPTFRANVLQNVLQMLSFSIWGNTYWGLRFPSCLLAFSVVVLLIRIIFCICKRERLLRKYYEKIVLCTLIFLGCNFPFLLAGKVAEGSIGRMFSVAFALWICCEYKFKDEERYFLLGLVSVLSIFFVYLSNVSLVLANIGLLFYILITHKEDLWLFIKNVFLGSLVGGLLSEVYYIKVWETGAIRNFFMSINSFSDRLLTNDNAKRSGGSSAFFISNMFFFDYVLLVLFLLGMFFLLLYLRKHINIPMAYTVLIILAFIFQTLFTSDYNERKSILVLPAVLIIICFGSVILLKWREENSSLKPVKWCYLCSIMIALIIEVIGFLMRKNWNYIEDFEPVDFNVILCSIAIQAAVLLTGAFASLYNRNGYIKLFLLLPIVISLMTNIFFDMKYMYRYNVFSEKNAMIAIGDEIGSNYVIAPYAIDFCLYNDIKPISNTFSQY